MKLTLKELQAIETEMLNAVFTICERYSIDCFLAYGSALGAVRHQGPIPWDSDADVAIPFHQLSEFMNVVRQELPERFFLDFHDVNKYYDVTFPRVGLKGYSSSIVHVDIFLLIGMPNKRNQQIAFRNAIIKLNRINFGKSFSNKYRNIGRRRKFKDFLIYRLLCFSVSKLKNRKKLYKMCAKFNYKDSKYIANSNIGYGLKEIILKDLYGDGKLVDYDGIKVRIPAKCDKYLEHFYGDYMTPPPEKERRGKNNFELMKLEM